jgi:hypothetical protein
MKTLVKHSPRVLVVAHTFSTLCPRYTIEFRARSLHYWKTRALISNSRSMADMCMRAL